MRRKESSINVGQPGRREQFEENREGEGDLIWGKGQKGDWEDMRKQEEKEKPNEWTLLENTHLFKLSSDTRLFIYINTCTAPSRARVHTATAQQRLQPRSEPAQQQDSFSTAKSRAYINTLSRPNSPGL
ncbi:hypothetical protein Q8A67_019807 [Cirrhinus molitorella]|uniref:Uncharacterized protein n=1 Tax=Cirrhinus molitorella TaxID=172907 RepID=A0AA88PM88_9TELE|nr:hypothetical protein Q8A67_019807 [Cirrhinus molitorella]